MKQADIVSGMQNRIFHQPLQYAHQLFRSAAKGVSSILSHNLPVAKIFVFSFH